MEKMKTVLGILALFTVLAIPAASAHATLYLVPQNSNVAEGYCHNKTVEVWINITAGENVTGAQFGVNYTYCCANITKVTFSDECDPDWSTWNAEGKRYCWGSWQSGLDWIIAKFVGTRYGPGDWLICNLTIHCCNETPPCETDLNFSAGVAAWHCPLEVYDRFGDPIPKSTINGTFTCGFLPSFSKELYEGWNLISLPLTPGDNHTNVVLSSLSGNYDAVYKYDAGSHSFVTANTMDPGTGYFVLVTTSPSMWTYSGTAYNSTNIGLKSGLNMVGWLNCSKGISDALSSIGMNYNYAARWNASSQSYEVYNQNAPAPFNDFFDMERGEGYWIVAKSDCTLTESCSG